jgi:AbrB family looped-hinge helix DNA binding protein
VYGTWAYLRYLTRDYEITYKRYYRDGPEETTVSDRGMVTIPASFRRRLDIQPGDKLRWAIDDEGTLSVEVVEQRRGAFDDFDPVAMGGGGAETHDLAGHEGVSDPSEPR